MLSSPPPPHHHQAEALAVAAVLLVYALVSLAFIGGPLFEGPDELEHYRYIQFIAAHGALPPPDGQPLGQYHQPPAYYALSAPLLALLGAPSVESFAMQRNPYYAYEIGATGGDNKNLYLHPLRSETSGGAAVVRVLRGVSLLLGLGTLLLIWRMSALLFRDTLPRLLMVMAAACTPQFVFLSSVLNNDALLIFMTTLCVWLLLLTARDGWDARRAALLGVCCGVLLLTKTNGLFFGLVVLLAFALTRGWRWLPLAALCTALVVGPWYARNLLTYDDLFLTAAWRRTWPVDAVVGYDAVLLGFTLERAPYALETVWARFGSGAVAVASWVHRSRDVALGVIAAGWGVGILRSLRRPQTIERAAIVRGLLLAATAASSALVLLYLTSQAWSGAQGRYLLPALSAWAACAGGGVALMPRRVRAVGALVVVGLLAAGLAGSGVAFRQAYQPLPPAPPAVVLGYRFGDAAELVGVTPAVVHARPGETTRVALHWRALGTPGLPLRTFVRSIALEGEPLPYVQRDSYPGTGNLLAEDWTAGRTWTERYALRLPDDAPQQQVVQLIAGLYDDPALPLAASLPDGTERIPVIAPLVLHGPTSAPPAAPLARYAERIALAALTTRAAEGGVEVCMTWAALREDGAPVRRFVHAFDAGGAFIAQVDGDARQGAYPAQYWRAGERVDDCVQLDTTAVAAVAVGWYDAATSARLPAVDAAGSALPDDVVRADG